MDRRTLLKSLAAAPVLATLPALLLAKPARAADPLRHEAAAQALAAKVPAPYSVIPAFRGDEPVLGVQATCADWQRYDTLMKAGAMPTNGASFVGTFDHGLPFDLPETLDGFRVLIMLPGVGNIPDQGQTHNVHLAGEGGWLHAVDIGKTVLGVLTACAPFGIVEGTIHITVETWGNIQPGLAPLAMDFVGDLPLSPDPAACDVVATRWLAHRTLLIENVPKCTLARIEIRVRVRDAITAKTPVTLRFEVQRA